MPARQQLRKIAYYSREFAVWPIPLAFFRQRLASLLAEAESRPDAAEIRVRADYCNRLTQPFEPGGVRIGEFRDRTRSTYYFDARRVLRYFPGHLRVRYEFGDITEVPAAPTLLKSRPVAGDNANSVLLKLNQIRHFRFVRDPFAYEAKADRLVWRGAVYKDRRRRVMERFHDHPGFDLGQTNRPPADVPWQKPFLSLREQLGNKFILCIEGNDVASGLKWALSSNSLCFMARPRFETWFMEGTLVGGQHYVEVRDDHADLPGKVDYYRSHPEEAKAIIHRAHAHVDRFRDPRRELLVSLLVLRKYFELSGQGLES